MKKVLKKFNRTLSIMLAAAMVLTMVPQTAMPVLAAENDVAIEETADVGETSEGLSDEQNEEVTEPSEEDSDEGNSEDEGDDITDEDPSDEDPVEEPSEGDLEEVEEPTIGVMGEGDNETDPPAENTVSVNLPANPQGYTITDAAETATKNIDYTFKIKANDNWRINAVKYKIGASEETLLKAGEDNVTYTIEGKNITGDITINVEAIQTFQVTVTAPDTVTVQYTVNDAVLDSATSPVTVDKGDKVKLTVTPKEDRYTVTVKKGTAKLNAVNKTDYNLGAINADVTVTVETAKNKYTITEDIQKIEVGEGEDKTQVVPAEIDYTKSGAANISKTDSDPALTMIAKSKPLKFVLKSANGVDLANKKVVVTYKVGAERTSETLAADKDGVYTILANKISDDITLGVEVREYEKYSITLEANSDIEEAKYFSKEENDFVNFPTPEEGQTNSVVPNVAEDSEFKFQLTAKKYYRIKEVKAGDEVLPVNKGVYTLTVTKAEKITVTTELDPTQQRNLTFKDVLSGSYLPLLSASINKPMHSRAG